MRNDLSGEALIEWARRTRENVWDSDILKETQEGWRNNTANAITKVCEHIERDGVDEERIWLLGGFVEYYVVLIEVVRKLAENSWDVDNDTCWEIHDEFMTRCHTDQWEKTLDNCIKYKLDPTRVYAIAIANAMLRKRRLYSKGLRKVRLLDDGLTVELELEKGERVFIKPESVQTSSARPLEDRTRKPNDFYEPWFRFLL
ncbi:MAG: hypothetical protein LUD72_06895, partial [Bacteroidales bacterium]|nr:hypothetical protein [Bacteroidales bacterium]